MALRRAWFIWSGCWSSRSATVLSSSGLSHADCFSASGPSRLCVVLAVLYLILSSSRVSSFVEAAFPSMMAWSELVLAADARKAGSASEVTEWMPSPPLLMGSEDWIHGSSVRGRLRIMLRPDLWQCVTGREGTLPRAWCGRAGPCELIQLVFILCYDGGPWDYFTFRAVEWKV